MKYSIIESFSFQETFLQKQRRNNMKNTIAEENNLGYIRVSVLGISQENLAKQTGIDRRVISAIELGDKIPSLRQAMLLSNALNYSVNDIFRLKEITM